MLSSLLLFGSSYKTNQFKYISYLMLMAYTLFVTDWNNGLAFPLINSLTLCVIPIIIQCFGGRTNTILSVLSILLYSIVIDTICFYLYPMFEIEQNIFQYIFSGLLFNYKSTIIPMIISIIIIAIRKKVHYESKIVSTRL